MYCIESIHINDSIYSLLDEPDRPPSRSWRVASDHPKPG